MSGTIATNSANTDAYAWIGPNGGSWDSTSNWSDTTTATSPAIHIPGTLTPATIDGPDGSTFDFITGGGIAASVALTGSISLAGAYEIGGAIGVGSQTVVSDQATLTAGALMLATGGTIAAGSVAVLDGTLSLAAEAAITTAGPIAVGLAGGIVPYNGAPGYDYTNGAPGEISIAQGATLETSGDFSVNWGSVTDADGLVNIGGSLTVGTAATSPESPPYTNTQLETGTIAVVSGGTLAVGGGITDLEGILLADGAGSQLIATGTLIAVEGASYNNASGVINGNLAATNGGFVQFGGLILTAPSSGLASGAASGISVDATSAIEIGASGGAAVGAITVDVGKSILAGAAAEFFSGAFVNNGTLAITGGVLTQTGNVSGSGVVQIGTSATWMLYGSVSSTVTIDFLAANGVLSIGSSSINETSSVSPLYAVSATITGFQAGDSIVVAQPINTAIYTAGIGSNPGTLVLANGAATIETLRLTGNFTGDSFAVSQGTGSGASVSLSNQPAPPVVILNAAPAASNTVSASLGRAAPATGVDLLAVALTSDADFASGSTLVLNNGTLVYTPGIVTVANAGTDTLTYTVTDTVTDLTTTKTQSVRLSNGPGPTVALATSPTASNTAPATLGIAVAGYGSDALSVALTSDADFTTGSTLVVNNGTLIYTPGLVTAAKAGTDRLAYTLTDTVTGAVTTKTQTVTLNNGPVPIITRALTPSASNAAPATLGTAAPGGGSDALSVALTLDTDFATGSTLVVNNGTLVYTPGLVTTANAGADTLGYTVTDTVTGAATNETQTVTLTSPGTPDILFQNQSGQMAQWTVSGSSISAGAEFGPNPGPSWFAMGTGAFYTGDTSDIVWQNTDGQVAVWQVQGTTVLGGGVVAGNPGTTWRIKGTGDFYGDGNTDILWQNDNGSVALWDMQGSNIVQGAVLAADPGPSWHIEGTGDFYGDGNTDILWQNDDGSVAIWDMSGATITQGAVVASNPGSTWHIKGTGDFYGDGNTDILWQNDNGEVAIWDMQGSSIVGGGIVATNPGPTWHIEAVGDFNNAGHADIVWQNDNGSVAVWEMNGTNIVSGAVLANPSTSWSVLGGDQNMRFIYSGAAGESLAATPVAPEEFVFTSVAAGAHTITGFNVTQDVVELSRAQGFGSFAAVQAATTAAAGGALIHLGASSTLFLAGVDPGSLHAGDFALA